MPTGTYTIDATNNTEPLDSRYVADFPAELRAMKTRMNNAISDLGSLTGALMTDGSNYMTGNLGVGVAASGGYKLDVAGNSRTTGTLAIVGKVTSSSTGFIPGTASVSNAAVTVSGAYGGGLVMVDGSTYGSVHLSSGTMKLGIGTSAGVTDKVSVESTVLKYLGATTAELQATPANGYAAARLLATGTNASYLFFDNTVSGECARLTADNAANLYASVGASAALSQIWYSDKRVGFYGDEINIGLGQSATQKRLLFNSSVRIVQLGLNTDNSVSLYDSTAGINRWISDTAGNFTAAGNVTAYSDCKLKHDIETISDALSKVQALRGVTFKWNRNNFPGIGFIAQEVEEVVPEFVHDSAGRKSVAYGNVTALLVEAVKELSTQLHDLKQELADIRGRK